MRLRQAESVTMWVVRRSGAQEAVREKKVDTGVVERRAHGANVDCMACNCMACGFVGSRCARTPKRENQNGWVLCNGAAFDTRSNQGVEGKRGKSMRW